MLFRQTLSLVNVIVGTFRDDLGHVGTNSLKDLDGQIWNYSAFLPSAMQGLVFLSYRGTGFEVLSEMERTAVLPWFCSFSR